MSNRVKISASIRTKILELITNSDKPALDTGNRLENK